MSSTAAHLVLHKEDESGDTTRGFRAVADGFPISNSVSWLDYGETDDRTLLDSATVPYAAPGSSVRFNVLHLIDGLRRHGSPAGLHFRVMGDAAEQATAAECLVGACPTEIAQFASSRHPDATKHPFLQVISISSAPEGSRITTPEEGHPTGRRVPLVAHTTSDLVNSVRFQYVAGTRREWRDIPLSALQFARPVNGSTIVRSRDIPVVATESDNGVDSRRLLWDLQAMDGGEVDGSVHVRAIFDEPDQAAGGVSPVVNFRLDRRNPETSATTPFGPGELDLLTGDLTMTTQDVTVRAWLSDLAVRRTFHSRGTSPRDTEMFGPHWASSFAADGGEMPYKRLYNYSEVDEEETVRWIQQPRTYVYDVMVDMPSSERCWEFLTEDFEWDVECEPVPNDPMQLYDEFTVDEWTPITDIVRWRYEYAQVELNDGSKITFKQTTNSLGVETGWEPDASHPGMKITKDGSVWRLTDDQGVTTAFEPDARDSPSYHPTSYQQPGSSVSPTFTWAAVDGRLRLTRVTAARLGGDSNEDRYLRFEWTKDATTGNQSRVTRILFGRYEDSAAALVESAVARYEYDGRGRLMLATEVRSGQSTGYAYDDVGRLTSLTPPGEAPWRFTYRFVDGDVNPGRLKAVTRTTPDHGDATWTVVYDVPLTGSGAPAQMDRETLSQWAQTEDLPADATAVFPPSHVPDARPASWARATVHYLDVDGAEVNTRQADGAISMAQYDANGAVSIELSDSNRERALASTDPAAVAKTLFTVRRYDRAGNEVSTLGPTHSLWLEDAGAVVRGRVRTITNYDEGKPATITEETNLPTSVSTAVLYDDANGQTVTGDVRQTIYQYSDTTATVQHRGWQIHSPMRVIVDPAGIASTTVKQYHATLPLLLSEHAPGRSSLGGHVRRFSYYGVAGSSCPVNAARVAGLPCVQTTDVAAGHTALPAFQWRYDSDWNKTNETKTVGSSVSTTEIAYNAAGRTQSTSVRDTSAAADPGRVLTTYHPMTGEILESRDESTGARVSRGYDTLGRLASYTDAQNVTTTYRYNLDGQLQSLSRGAETTRYSYDDRGQITSVLDSNVGVAITGSYDDDGNLIEQRFPNGLVERRTFDASGASTRLSYTKAGCGSACVWVDDQVIRDSQMRIVSEATDEGRRRAFTYDRVGRLRTAEDVSARGICTTRVYSYDESSNRLTRLTYPAAAGGACSRATSATVQQLSYDSADRALSSDGQSFTYDAMGRTTVTPAAAAGATLTATYFANDRVRSLEQGGLTRTYERDPLGRTLRRTTSGSSTMTESYHYSGDSDMPYAISDSTGVVERNIEGLDGDLIATSDGRAITYSLADLRGNVVALASDELSATAPFARSAFDEFGIPETPGATRRYGWHGQRQRSTEFATGLIEMGVRTYSPHIGRFLQGDPVDGGSANAYDYANQDPVNNADVDGDAWGILIRLAPPVFRGLKTAFGAGVAKVATKAAAGTRTAITGFTKHGMKQVLGRDGGRGVNPFAIRDAMLNPNGGARLVWRYNKHKKGWAETHVYEGRYAKVVLNSRGEVITAHAKKGSGKKGVLRP